MPIPRIFISYSHDSDAHRDFVLSLSNRLRADGLDCQIDQYVNGFPAEGWQRWMETQVEVADFVLVVCTPLYLKRYRGLDRDGGRGVTFEGVVISQSLYDVYYQNTKFVPVLPEGGVVDDVPMPLKGFGAFGLMGAYVKLFRYLTGQPEVAIPEVGEIPTLANKQPVDFDDSLKQFTHYGVPLNSQGLEASGLSDQAVENIKQLLDDSLKEQVRNLRQKDDHIELLNEQIARLKLDHDAAIKENQNDQQNNPDDLLLAQEQEALQAYDLKRAAELRERYYQAWKLEKKAKIAEMQMEMAREAFVSASRWESAFDMAKALVLYQEAVGFKPGYLEAWRKIILTAEKLGNNQLALDAVRNLQKQLDPEKDLKWLLIAFNDEGDALSRLGDNQSAIECYQKSMKLTTRLLDTEPDNPNWQRDLSVSYDRVGDMHLNIGDSVAALKAYEESFTIRKKLIEFAPTHPERQRDFSVSKMKVGDLYQKTGNNISALKVYEESLTVSKKLAELNPTHSDWQRDLSVIYERVGDMNLKAGNDVAALEAYQESLTIRKKLVELAPTDTDWQRDLWVSHNKVGDMPECVNLL